MPILSKGKIRYFQFRNFDLPLSHAIFTRHGGVSPDPWASLNLGSTVGDDLERVHENRRIALATLERDPACVYEVWQVHGVEVAIAEGPRPPQAPLLQADAILTDRPGLTLMMRFADCVSILLHDPVRRVVGIAHAGWMGTVRGTVRFAVDAMQKHYNSNPADIQAAIGPSIGLDHYEVGPDVVIQVQQAFGNDASGLLSANTGAIKFDLWAANRLLLEQAGVRHVEEAGICTACHTEDWFSHRAEKGRTGRFGAIIALE
jgi:YfiH family protein